MDINSVYIRQLSRRIRSLERENAQLRHSIETLHSMLNDEKKIRRFYFNSLDTSKFEQPLKDWYLMRLGKPLDLENPRTFNEKLQWLKLYDCSRQKADLSDKYKVRGYVAEKIGEKYLVPLLGVWNTPDEIPFDKMPEKFVLKATHGCKYNIIVTDKSSLDTNAVKEQLRQWLAEDYAFHNGFELHYSLIDRRIIAEEYIENTVGDLCDYKVFCFDGKAKFIEFITQRRNRLKKGFYDTQWNLMPVTNAPESAAADAARPENLEELLKIAEALAEGFIHVRVDLYILNDGTIKFSEMTFTSASGASRWDPPEFDGIFGDYMVLPTADTDSPHDFRKLTNNHAPDFKSHAGEDFIKLEWKADPNADFYKLQQQFETGWRQIAAPIEPTYTVKGLDRGTNYFFRIFAAVDGKLGHPILISGKTL